MQILTPWVLTPPAVVFDESLLWLLRVAFASSSEPSTPVDESAALALARRFELSGRIAQRVMGQGRSELLRELSEDFYTNLAVQAVLDQCLERAAELAERLSVPVIALKYAGLRWSGVIEPGTRVVGDIDLLVPEAQAKFFWRALLDAGFVRTRSRGYAHQLEALVDPYGAVLELHLNVPGVCLGSRGFANATADELMARGLVRRSKDSILVPNYGLLAAHALTHGLVQNWSTPQSYSPLRMMADLLDLRRAQPDVLALAERYLRPEMADLCRAAEDLCAALEAGIIPHPDSRVPNAHTLLRHCVAARCDAAYATQLRSSGLQQKLSDGSSWPEVVRYLGRALFPSAPELDVIYGPAVGLAARVARRLRRPLELTWRVARAGLRPLRR